MATTVVSWNIAKRHEAWRQLVDIGADVALLQEAGMPPADVADKVDTGPREHWIRMCGIRSGGRAAAGGVCSTSRRWW